MQDRRIYRPRNNAFDHHSLKEKGRDLSVINHNIADKKCSNDCAICILSIKNMYVNCNSFTFSRSLECCGADKRVDSANKLSYMSASVVSARDNEGNIRQDNRYNKSDDFIAGITNVYVNVRGGCM